MNERLKHRTWETIDIYTGEKRFVPHTDKTQFIIYEFAFPEDTRVYYGAFIARMLVEGSESRDLPSDPRNWLIEYGVDENQIVNGDYGCHNNCDENFKEWWEFCPICGYALGITCADLQEEEKD